MSILYPIKGKNELTDSYLRYSNQCIADDYKLIWRACCIHYEIEWSSNSAVLDSVPALMWGKCKSCNEERYYPIEE